MRSLDQHLKAPSMTPSWSEVGPGATEGCAGGSCGVVARFLIEVDDVGVIVQCTARVRGRASAFATASALCEAARGRSVVDAARLGLGTLHESFAAMSPEDAERALVVEDAFHHTLGRWVLARMRDTARSPASASPSALPSALPAQTALVDAVVGMSGGVDSAVALHRTATACEGRVAGVTLRLWIDARAPDPEAACCSPDSVRRARSTCHAAGLPHLSIDLRAAFTAAVVAPFIAEYERGDTPNPCVRCNGHFRLDELVRLADVLGAEHVVTGHYARIVRRHGAALLARGVDSGKDQSYMLSQVAPETLARMRFPLGELCKPQVRAEAAALGLVQATTPESQEVCFLGGGDYRDFLRRAGALGTPGELVIADPDGGERVVGHHDGIARFTPGQRRGIGIAADQPLYVHDVEPTTGRVLLGPSSPALARTTIEVADLRWHDASPPDRVRAQVRHRAAGGAAPASVRAHPSDSTRWLVEFDEPQRAPAAGQAVALYDDGDVVVGSGRMVRPTTLHDAAMDACVEVAASVADS